MENDYKKQKWNTAAGATAASYLEMLWRNAFDEKMNSFINLHPVLKMYFDSDLSSEIESNAFLAISNAILSTVEEFTKQGAFSRFHIISIAVAHIVCKRMFLLKLIYHANRGRISKEKFCELAAEHFAVEIATILNKLWDMAPTLLKSGIIGVLTYCGMDPIAAKLVADKVNGFFMSFHPFVKKFITREKTEELLKYTIDFTIKSARTIIAYAEQVENILKSKGRSICVFLGWKVPDFLKDVNTGSVKIYVEKDWSGQEKDWSGQEKDWSGQEKEWSGQEKDWNNSDVTSNPNSNNKRFKEKNK